MDIENFVKTLNKLLEVDHGTIYRLMEDTRVYLPDHVEKAIDEAYQGQANPVTVWQAENGSLFMSWLGLINGQLRIEGKTIVAHYTKDGKKILSFVVEDRPSEGCNAKEGAGHVPDWGTLRPVAGGGGVVDVWCEQCGLSGSFRVVAEDINW